jgi:tetratricopeptide (TPR) repeat protein
MATSIYENPQLASHRKNFIRCMKEGNSFRHAGEYDQALKHFSDARQHAYKLLSVRPLVLSRCYLFIADVHQLKGKYARAARYYEKAVRYAVMDRRMGKNHKHIAWLKALAKACRRKNRDTSFLLPSLIRLALDIALTEIEIGGALAVGYFAIGLANDVWELAEAVRKR